MDSWWKELVVYQIYPRSFADSNGDGIGDIPGIIGKLDYLQALGVGALWLSPIYCSPNDDGGYDISDYQGIHPEFGTIDDFDRLLHEMHRRGIRLVMDTVVNHTSVEHPWFRSSRSDRNNPYRPYYIWRPGQNGGPPNNWRSLFAGSAWELNPQTGDYFLHYFSRRMPDLNWEHPEVRQAIYAMMRWWLDRGVDGLRLDVINLLHKAVGFPDAADPNDTRFYWNQPAVHAIIREMHREVFSRYDMFTVGETVAVSPEAARLFVNQARRELDMLFQFEHFGDYDPRFVWDLRTFKMVQWKYYQALRQDGWNAQFIGNHDSPRAVSRFGNDHRYRRKSAMLLGTMNLTLWGTPFIFQGDEIGMTNVVFPSIDDYRDVQTIGRYHEAVAMGVDPESAFKAQQFLSRDNARTPMQWSPGPGAGFTHGEPWIGINPNSQRINVQTDRGSRDSVGQYYRRLIALRRITPALVYGDYVPYLEDHPALYVYERRLDSERVLVTLNLSSTSQEAVLPQVVGGTRRRVLLGNYPRTSPVAAGRPTLLAPWEARIERLD